MTSLHAHDKAHAHPSAAPLPVRAWLPPVLPRTWRALGELQIGADPDHAIVVHGVSTDLYEVVRLLDGRRTTQEAIGLAVSRGAPRDSSVALVRALAAAGCLVDLDPGDDRHRPATWRPTDEQPTDTHPEDRPALMADLAARSLGGRSVAPGETLARRAAASVVIHGARRVGTTVGALLASAGVGRVSLVDDGIVTAADVLPGGYTPPDIGAPRSTAAREAVRRTAPSADTSMPDSMLRPDLVVVTEPWPEAGERERLFGLIRTPCLYAAVRESRAVVGPFVLPGVTSCLRCQHLHRADRDPGWTAVATQLRLRTVDAAGGSVLSLLAASLACLQALDWVDTRAAPTTADATVEFTSVDLSLVRRPWTRHPACRCARNA